MATITQLPVHLDGMIGPMEYDTMLPEASMAMPSFWYIHPDFYPKNDKIVNWRGELEMLTIMESGDGFQGMMAGDYLVSDPYAPRDGKWRSLERDGYITEERKGHYLEFFGIPYHVVAEPGTSHT